MCWHISSTFSSSKPNTAAIVLGFASQAFCIACARTETSSSASAKLNVPLATNAENSPKECPATMAGLAAAIFLNAATACIKTAGCVMLVCFKSSSLPVNIISLILKPSISFASSNNSLEAVLLSYKFLPIPLNCAPCPGKINACFIG